MAFRLKVGRSSLFYFVFFKLVQLEVGAFKTKP